MPNLEELEILKSQVNRLGKEALILSERGETIPDIPPEDPRFDTETEELQVEPIRENRDIDESQEESGLDEMEALLDSYAEDLENLESTAIDDFAELPTEEDFTTSAPPSEKEPPVLPSSDFNYNDFDTDAKKFTPKESETMGLEDSPFPGIEDPPLVDENPPSEKDDFDLDSYDFPDFETSPGELSESDIADLLGIDAELTDTELTGTELTDTTTAKPEEDTNEAPTKPTSEDLEHFSFEHFGDEYKFNEQENLAFEEMITEEQRKEVLGEEKEEKEEPFTISEEDLFAIRESLLELPLNLKLAIEQFLADEHQATEDVQSFITLLLSGSSPRILAKRYYNITKRRILLPRSSRKLSGQVLAKRHSILIYRILEEKLPILRTTLVLIILIWLLGLAGFMWIYRPLKAESLYSLGRQSIAVDKVEEATEYFQKAWNGWPLFESSDSSNNISTSPIVVAGWKEKRQWLIYAREFRRRKHWSLAGQFYESYIAVKKRNKDARLEYSDFLSHVTGQYETAIHVLQFDVNSPERKWDQDLVLAAGDVYLRWAEDDPAKYENARFHYAEALEKARDNERAILSMMRYHLTLQNREEVQLLLPIFQSEILGDVSESVLAAEVFSRLAEFHLEEDKRREAWRFLELATNANPDSPEAFFARAQYWQLMEDDNRMLNDYDRTLVNLGKQETFNRNSLRMRVLSLAGIGRFYKDLSQRLPNPAESEKAYQIAINNYSNAIDFYEDAQSRNQLGASPEYGNIYLEVGDLLFQQYQGDGDLTLSLVPKQESLTENSEKIGTLRQAEDYYNMAEKFYNRGERRSALPDGALYRRAYARYVLGMENALIDFHRITRRRPSDYEARMAAGTVLLQMGDYEASRTQFARTIELLDTDLRNSGEALDPSLNSHHEDLLIRYVVAWNNLGVVRAQSAEQDGNQESYAAALGAFTMASEYLDLVLTGTPNLTARGAVGLRDSEQRRIVDRIERINFLREKASFPYRNRLRLLGEEKTPPNEETYLVYTDIPSALSGTD